MHQIDNDELLKIWKASKVKGFKVWYNYHMGYKRYKDITNFGVELVEKYELPYKVPKKLDK